MGLIVPQGSCPISALYRQPGRNGHKFAFWYFWNIYLQERRRALDRDMALLSTWIVVVQHHRGVWCSWSQAQVGGWHKAENISRCSHAPIARNKVFGATHPQPFPGSALDLLGLLQNGGWYELKVRHLGPSGISAWVHSLALHSAQQKAFLAGHAHLLPCLKQMVWKPTLV